jgi:hypothetical protein
MPQMEGDKEPQYKPQAFTCKVITYTKVVESLNIVILHA